MRWSLESNVLEQRHMMKGREGRQAGSYFISWVLKLTVFDTGDQAGFPQLSSHSDGDNQQGLQVEANFKLVLV